MKSIKMKISMVCLLIFMLVVGTACGNSNTASNENGGSNAESDKGSAKPIEFKIGHMNSTEHVQHTVKADFAEDVAGLTEERVTFKIYPGGALGGPKETYDNIVNGVMDVGWGLQGYNAGKFPTHAVLQLPFMAEGNGASLSVVAQKLYDTFPEIQKEYSDVKPLWFHSADPYMIVTKGKAVRSFEDVKGLKLRTPSVEGSAMIESWGATPVSLPAPEIYDAISKGVIDGGVLPIAAIKDFNLFDVVDYVTYGNYVTSLFYVVMNDKSWNKISPEDQAKIEEQLGVPMAQKAGEAFDAQKEKSLAESKEAGIEFITLPDGELQKFKDASSDLAEKWISDMEAKGIPGQKIYDEAVKLIQEGK